MLVLITKAQRVFIKLSLYVCIFKEKEQGCLTQSCFFLFKCFVEICSKFPQENLNNKKVVHLSANHFKVFIKCRVELHKIKKNIFIKLSVTLNKFDYSELNCYIHSDNHKSTTVSCGAIRNNI